MSCTPTPDRDPPLRKATLFCPSCDHESPVDGDWRVSERAGGIEYRCPNCEARITERDHGRSLVKA